MGSENNDLAEPAIHRYTQLPKAQGYITDLEDLLSTEEEVTLSQIISRYEQQTTNEIAILTVSSFLDHGDPLKFAIEVGDYWGVGKENKNNGVVIVVSDSLRQTAIATGYGIEKMISNTSLDSIIQQVMIPHFAEKDYGIGLERGI